MKCKVIYFTRTGHSRKIAQALAKELQIEAEDIKANPVVGDLDLLFIVGGIYGGKSDPRMIDYIKGIDGSMVKKAALLTSCASKVMKQETVREMLERNNVALVPDEFICQGSFLLIGRGHPDAADIDNAVAYAKRVLSNEA